MFSLHNLYNKNGLVVRIEHDKAIVEFDISTVINKRNKDDLDPEKQFLLLNGYLDYKGDSFKKELMNKYLAAEDTLTGTLTRKDINPLPLSISHSILNMFKFKDVLDYVTNVYKVVPPQGLKTEFNKVTERDGDGTRAQTYLKTDYLELAALVVIIKSVLGPIGQFSYLKNNMINGLNKEHILYTFISTHKIFNTAPMQKLLAFSAKLVEISFKSDEIAAVRVIEKRIPKDDMPLYILSSVIFSRIIISSIVDDVDGNNVITKMHTYISNKLNIRKDVSSAISNKHALSTSEGGEGERDSIVESYRVISNLTAATVVELCWAVSNIEFVIGNLPVPLDPAVVKDALAHNQVFYTHNISKQQLVILGTIFKDIIDPRALVYLSNKELIGLMSIGFAYLWAIDCKHMAILLNSVAEVESGDTLSINSSVNRTRITKELKDKLAFHYPYSRVINATTNANVAEEAINLLAINIYDTKWNPIVGDIYVKELVENRSMLRSVPSDLKIKLAEMFIKLEENRI